MLILQKKKKKKILRWRLRLPAYCRAQAKQYLHGLQYMIESVCFDEPEIGQSRREKWSEDIWNGSIQFIVHWLDEEFTPLAQKRFIIVR